MTEPFKITTAYDEGLIAERFDDDDRIFVTVDNDLVVILDRDHARALAEWMLAVTEDQA